MSAAIEHRTIPTHTARAYFDVLCAILSVRFLPSEVHSGVCNIIVVHSVARLGAFAVLPSLLRCCGKRFIRVLSPQRTRGNTLHKGFHSRCKEHDEGDAPNYIPGEGGTVLKIKLT